MLYRSNRKLAFATLLLCMAATTGRAQTVLAPMALDAWSVEARSPSISARPGVGVGCAWVSREAGRARIAFREQFPGKSSGAWTEPVFFEGRGGGENLDSPVLLYDSDSNPHLIWREGSSSDSVIAGAYRHSGLWVRRSAISKPGSGETAAPAAAFDANGHLHVVWQEGCGSFWRIMAATFAPNGTLRRHELTAGEPARLNLYPAIIGRYAPLILWFSEDSPDFGLRTRQFDAETGQWRVCEAPNLAELPTNRLPYLFGLESNLVCAVWGREVEGVERIFFGFSDKEEQGEGLMVDDNPLGTNSQPCAVLGAQGPAVCWRAETPQGPAIHVRRHNGKDWTPSAILSLPEPPYASQPRIAPGAESLHIVWVSESSDGGTGNVYYSAARWPGVRETE